MLKVPLDYITGITGPPLEDLKIHADEFIGLRGTHALARQTLMLLKKFTVPNWKL